MSDQQTLSYSDVLAARARIGGRVRVTPMIESEDLNLRCGGRVLIKLESLQVGGAFKFRGALNALLGRPDRQRHAGVVAFSSGNHAIAVSTAAAQLGVPCVIVMPADAPKVKLDCTRANGAEVILYDRDRDDREAIGRDVVRLRGFGLVPPFDDPLVIAGQGTVGLEIAEQAEAMGACLDILAVPCSGGGLAAGCALALSQASPATSIVTVEPSGFDDMARSLEANAPVRNTRTSGSICDALLAPAPGIWTLPILLGIGARGVAVHDEAVLEAMRVAHADLRVVLEPAGAAALAAVLSGQLRLDGRTIAIICSGGNTDPATILRALSPASNTSGVDVL